MYNYDSFYKPHSNQSLDWLPMDTKELYEHNLLHRYNDLSKFGWVNKKFTYKFNSLGFRCDEFTDDPSVMFLGCSHTIGVGLPLEHTWPQLVSKQYKLTCINLAIGGGSADGAFRLCYGYIDKIKPKIVILTLPPGIRFELVTSTTITNVMASNHPDPFVKRKWAVDDNNHYFNQQKNTLAIKMLCQERGIKFLTPNVYELLNCTSLARDLAHSGIEDNHRFSEVVANMI